MDKLHYYAQSKDDSILIGFYRRHGNVKPPLEQYLGHVCVDLKPTGFSDSIMVAVKGFDGDNEYRIPCESTPGDSGEDVRRNPEASSDDPACGPGAP